MSFSSFKFAKLVPVRPAIVTQSFTSLFLDEARQSAVQMASDKYARQRAEGWRVHHVLRQIDEMVRCDSTNV